MTRERPAVAARRAARLCAAASGAGRRSEGSLLTASSSRGSRSQRYARRRRQELPVRARRRRPSALARSHPVGLVEHQRARRHDDRRPARARLAQPPAIRASVCASTADVGSTSTRISASESSARASTSRWRWPPENDRPRSSIVASRPSGSASSTSSAFAIATAEWIAVVLSPPPGIQAGAERAGEEDGLRLADDDPSPNRLDREMREPHVAEQGPVLCSEPPEPVGDRSGFLGRRGDEQVMRPGSITSPTAGRQASRPAGGSAAGLSGSRISRSTLSTLSIC